MKALEVYKVFRDYGVAIPDDVSIVAHDELAANQLLIPPLDSIMPDYDKIIPTAHSELCKTLRGEQAFFRLRLTPTLTERGSVRTFGESPCSDRKGYAFNKISISNINKPQSLKRDHSNKKSTGNNQKRKEMV